MAVTTDVAEAGMMRGGEVFERLTRHLTHEPFTEAQMPARIDITGQRFGRLVALERHCTHGRAYWLCRCDCGSHSEVYLNSLKSGATRSCGCLHDETHWKHGHNGKEGHSPTYSCWDNIINRCLRPSHGGYPQYGGRGITVCERWLTFANFLADMGERPSLLHSIDRIDNSKGYEPGNCRWATQLEQVRNSSRPKAVVRSDGKRYAAVIDAAKDVGIDYTSIVKTCRGQRRSAGGYGWSYG